MKESALDVIFIECCGRQEPKKAKLVTNCPTLPFVSMKARAERRRPEDTDVLYVACATVVRGSPC